MHINLQWAALFKKQVTYAYPFLNYHYSNRSSQLKELLDLLKNGMEI